MYFQNPTISRQGQLAYEQFSIDESIWRIEMPAAKGQSAVPHPFQNSTRPDWNMDISPDGNSIVFASYRSGNTEIWLCDRNGHNAVQLTAMGTGTPRWSPDGQHITFDARPKATAIFLFLM
jgi:Tol biopolymer transport system component